MLKNKKIITALFFVLVLFIKAALFLFLKNDIYFASTFVDERWVLEQLDGRHISLYVYSPGYVVFLKLYTLMFPATKISIQIFQIVFSSAINALIFFFLTELTNSLKAFFIALIPIFFAPVAIFSLRILPVAIWPELLILSLLLLFVSIRKDRGYYYFSGSSVLVCAALMRPNLLLLVPVVAILFFFIWKRSITTFSPLVLTLLLTGLIGFVNYSETGEFLPLTANGGVNFFMGNNELSHGVYMPVKGVRDEIGLQLNDSVRIYAENSGDNGPTMSKASKWWYLKSLNYLAENPVKAMRLYMKKTAFMFRNEEYSSSFATDFMMERYFLPFFGFSILFGLFIFFVFLSHRSLNRSEKIFWLVCLVFSFAGVIPFTIDSRYRLGFSITVLTLTMIMMTKLDLKKALENKVKLIVSLICAVVIFTATTFPKQKGNLYYAWYSLGNLYVEKSEWNEALESFSQAVKDNPYYPHAWNNLGMTYLMLKGSENAQKAFKKAVEIEPENPMFRKNLKRSQRN